MTSAILYDMLCLSERHGINTSIDCTDETIVVMWTSLLCLTHPRDERDAVYKNGNGAYLIALVSYGNNSYGDALYELCIRMRTREGKRRNEKRTKTRCALAVTV